jgi:hypothetical protein
LLERGTDIGVWKLKISETFRQALLLPDTNYEGVFKLDLARKQEEYDFFALGHPLIMNIANWTKMVEFGGYSSEIPISRKKWAKLFQPPHINRLIESEIPVFQRTLKNKENLNCFFFEVEYIGVIVEKMIIPIIMTETSEFLPTPSTNFIHLSQIWDLLDLESDFTKYGPSDMGNSDVFSYDSIKDIEKIFLNAKTVLKTQIKSRSLELIQLNKQKYAKSTQKAKKLAKFKRKFAELQLESSKLNFRAKKLKLPTNRQRENLEKITNVAKKNSKKAEFLKKEQEVEYYQGEILRWERILENLEFDLPEQIKRLKKYRKLWVNANLIGFAKLILI